MKGKLYITAVSMLVLTFVSPSILVLTASGQGNLITLIDTPHLVRSWNTMESTLHVDGRVLSYAGDQIYALRNHSSTDFRQYKLEHTVY